MIRQELRKATISTALAVLSAPICFLAVTPAMAVDFSPPVAGLCGVSNLIGASVIDRDGNGNIGVIAPTRNDTLDLDDDDDGFATGVLRLTIELLNDDGNRIWQRSGFTVAANEILLANPLADDMLPATIPNVPTRHLPYYSFGFICEGWGTVESGAQRYLYVSNGTTGVDSDAGDTDQSVVKVWIVNLANGNIVQTHRIIPQGGKYLLAFNSGFLDFDNDGNDELVVFRASYLGDTGNRSRFRITVEVFNLLTGVLEQQFNTIVSDTFLNNNPLP